MNLFLDQDQLKAISAIVADAGQVFFALTVIPFIFGLDRMNSSVLLFGLALTIMCWAASIMLAKRRKK